jgi:hypothetical protein
MKQKKGYITILLLLLGGFAIAKMLKKKSKVIVSNPNKVAYSKNGSTVYKYDLITPIYTFKKEIELTVLEQDENLPFTKVSFMANNVLKTGWINDNNIIKL